MINPLSANSSAAVGCGALPDYGRLLFAGQFVLGPSFAGHFAGWQKIDIDGALKLTIHPDLACTRVTDGQRSLTLVGHILDPLAPAASNDDILRHLLHRFTGRSALIKATSGYGGRWIIIATSGQEKFLFNDALGLRQVFYTNPVDTGRLWAMSQPGIGAEVLSLVPDEAATAYIDSPAFRSHPEYRWPGEASPFQGLKHLLPNHWLDLTTGTSHRYWPREPLACVEPEVAIERLSVLLPGIIRAAAQRFDLVLSITAGLDSRLVLAAARGMKDKLPFVTVQQGKVSDNHADLTVPGKLLEWLGLPHEVICTQKSMTPEFSQTFKRSVYLAHDHYGPDAEAILRRFSRTRAALTGSGAEVMRCAFQGTRSWYKFRKITPKVLSRIEFGTKHDFVIAHLRDWHAAARRQQHVKLLDLFEWEQGHGNWLAMTQLEFDIAWREIITPYNCREVLTTVLGVDEYYRRAPDYLLFMRLMERLWPEVLSEPINPHKQKTRIEYLMQRLKHRVATIFNG